MPIFRVKFVKIYTGQKKFTRTPSARPWQIWGMNCTADLYGNNRAGLGSTGMWSPFTCYASSTHPLLAGGGRGYPAIGVWTPCRNSHPAFCPQLSTQSFPNPQFNSTLLFPKSWATQNFDNATMVETQQAEANMEMIFLPDLFLILFQCQNDI